MKHLLFCCSLFVFFESQAQQINPVPDYVFRNQMSVGRNAVTDTAAYISIGPRYGANKGLMPPMVIDTAGFSGTKRNGLLIFSIQKNKYVYWDSVGSKWAEMAGVGGSAINSGDTATMLTPYTRGSGTTNYVPKFTGTRTFGNSQIFDNGTNIGFKTTSPIAPFSLGNANYYPSNDPFFLVSRLVNDDGGMSGSNAHAISEASIINRSGGIAFAGIENRQKFSGTNNYDHYAGFQNGLTYRSTGTLLNYFGYYDSFVIDSGTVTNSYGIYLGDNTKAAGATLTNNYGMYFANRTSGTNDWTIYSNSDAPTYFKGNMNIGKIITNEGNTAAVPSAEIEIQTASGTKADLRLYQLGNNLWDIQIPANQTYLTLGDIANTYVWFKNGGEVNIGSVTDNGDFKLQVNGNTLLNGKTLVNTTTDAGFQFDVNGTARTGTLTVNTNGQGRTISTNQASGTIGNNIFIGGAGGTLTGTTGNQSSFNTTVGIEAGNTITTAENNVAVGYRALRDMTTSSFNTSIGNNSQRLNTTGSSNTTLGAGTLESNLTGIQNTAIGRGALAASTASNSTAVGFDALRASTTGINEAFGATALQSVTTGSANAAFGRGALFNVVTTNNNTALGNGAGQLTSGSYANANPINSTYLGTNARPADSAQTNQIVIGHNTIGNGSNTVTIGNSSITQNYFTGEMLVGYTSDQGAFSLQANGNALINGNIRTAAPAGGTANDWRLGTVATVTPTSPNRTIEVSIGGTIYYIHAKTTND
jgi:hypothetical protein